MKTFCVLVFVTIAFPVLAPAQNLPPQPGFIDPQRRQDQQNQDDLRRAQAIDLVQNIAAEAPLWSDKKTAVRVLADAADLLWDETPGNGASWLTKAWELIDQAPESPKNESLKEFFTRSDQTYLRTAVLSVAHRHDAKLAQRFLKQLSQKEPNEKKDRGAFDDRTARSEQLLSLAQQAVDVHPELAFSLAQSSLADGVSYSLQNVLTSLRKKNVELANRLFDSALARFGSSEPDPSEGEVLAGYLFQSGFTFSANSSGQTILVVNPAQQNLPAVAPSEPQRARNFLIAVYQVLLARPISVGNSEGNGRAQRTLILGKRLWGPYDIFAPEFAQPARGFLAQLQRQLSPDGQTGTLDRATRPATGDESTTKHLTNEEIYEKHLAGLEEIADKQINRILKKLAYVEAALASKPEDYQRAKRVAEKIDDDDLRADAVSFVLYRAALFFVEKAEVEKALEIAPQISRPSRRAVVKIAIAQSLMAPKGERIDQAQSALTKERVLDLLNDIGRDLKNEEPSTTTVKILLGRTAVMAKLDKDQALASLEQTIQMINKLDRFDLRDGAAPNLALAGSAASGATVAGPRTGFDFRTAIEPLVTTSLEQITAAAERLTARELSGVGRLEVAKLCLLKKHGGPSLRESSRSIR